MLETIKRAVEIGKAGNPSAKFILSACIDCGKERWVKFLYGKPAFLRCVKCSNKEKRSNWKGGRSYDDKGYIRFFLQPDDFFYPMTRASDNYVLEHRLVMARHLGRCLLPWEIVHHKNGIPRDDNRIEGLQLINDTKYHLIDAIVKQYIRKLEKRVTLLEADNVLLREQLQ